MWAQLRTDPRFIVGVVVVSVLSLMAVAPQWFVTVALQECDLDRSRELPSPGHWFGFDLLGCDLWTQSVYGTRPSFVAATVATSAAALLAAVGGLLAGYVGGAVDAVIARLTDAWLSFPVVLGGAVVLALTEERGIANVTLVLALFNWPVLLRLLRTAARTERSADYVTAARALGAGPYRVLRHHVLPNASGPFVAYLPVAFATAVAGEATLSYLGIGLQLPTTSWGLLLAEPGERFLASWHLTALPALFLAVAVASLLVVGDAVRSAVDGRRA